MREAGRGSSRWALKNVTYFDHSTHRFVAGDLEIDGDRIGALRPPGTSMLGSAVDARPFVCTPGLVRTHADFGDVAHASGQWLRAGITTVGTSCATARQCVVAARQAPQRVVARLTLNEFARARCRGHRPDARAGAPELRALARIDTLMRRHGGRLALAVRCAAIGSAFELVYAYNLAAAAGLALGFEFADSPDSARAFRERFYSSETELLSFLQLLHHGTTVWGLSQLTRHDVDLLVRSGARRLDASPIGTSTETAFPGSRLSALAGRSATSAEGAVDAATIDAAGVLGQTDCGRISEGMQADLCLFRAPHGSMLGADSAAFVQLYDSSEPLAVIVAGSCIACPTLMRCAASAPCIDLAAHEYALSSLATQT
ncbi:amidohydrolase family protein [Trinickia diaoshuihuensis]|uniref:amidohydrolase family protein n=1 Tax=Trinickia diaoshuihuensis TaxID=2292265 RepID=UPI0013C335BF|nr:amidohydrolase family protein [Trinickia diaoshuihuensis]